MKKNRTPWALLSLVLLLSSCSSTPKVDLEAEYQKRPNIVMSWEGVEEAPSVAGSFCSAVLCLDSGDPDWAAMTFTPFVNGTPFEVHISTNLVISDISISLKDATGHTVQNNIPHSNDDGNGTYTVSESFTHTGDEILSVKVHFADDGGYGQTFFPLAVQ